jgi:hypothetical protein
VGDGHVIRRVSILLILALAACEGELVDPVGQGGAITGRVVDGANGTPVSGALVTTSPDVGRATTDDQGRYRISGIPLGAGTAAVMVEATHAGFDRAVVSVALSKATPTISLDLLLPRLGSGLDEGALRVEVTDLAGRPVAQAIVRAIDLLGRTVAAAVADTEGAVRFDLPSGRYRIDARGGGELAGIRAETNIDVTRHRDVTVHLALGRFDVRTSVRGNAIRDCVAEGDTVEFQVDVLNGEDVVLPDVVIHDTLSGPLARRLTPGEIVIDRELFPDATVIVNPDGFSFSVHLGRVAPSADWIEAFRFVVLTRSQAAAWCDRATARATTPLGGVLIARATTSCSTSTLPVVLGIDNDDGFLDGNGDFRAEKETFRVGEGGPARPTEFIYRVALTNGCRSDTRLAYTGIRVSDQIAPTTGNIAFREVLAGYPTMGRVVSSSDGELTWWVDKLLAGQTAEIRFRAEALSAGEAVNLVEATATEITGSVRNEETTTITP